MNQPENPESKIISHADLPLLKKNRETSHLKIVFTNGCFDILHAGHVDYLFKASALGDLLIVGLNTDESVRRLKGPGRPIQDQHARALILASLQYVNYVILFGEDTPLKLITAIQPDVLVKGSDYRAEDIVGYDVVTQHGGRVETIDFLEGYSTTSLIERIRGRE